MASPKCREYFESHESVSEPNWYKYLDDPSAPEFQVFIFSRSLQDVWGSHQNSSGHIQFNGKNINTASANDFIVDKSGKVTRVKNLKWGAQLIQAFRKEQFEVESIPFKLQLSGSALEELGFQLPNADSGNFMEVFAKALYSLAQLASSPENFQRFFTEREATGAFVFGALGLTTKIDQLSKLVIQAFGFDLNNADISWKTPKNMPHPLEILQHYKSQLIEKLQASYEKQGLPKEVTQQLLLQEAALADGRTIEFMILQRAKLVSYSRIYIGNTQVKGEASPGTVELSRAGIKLGEVANYLLPAERSLHPNSKLALKIQKLREQANIQNKILLELGRTFISSNFKREKRQIIKSMHFKVLEMIYRHLSGNNLEQIIQIANAGMVGRAHYRKHYGFEDVDPALLSEGSYDPYYRFDLLIDLDTEVNTEAESMKSDKLVYVLESNAADFFKEIFINNKNIDLTGAYFGQLEFDPRLSFMGAFLTHGR